MIEAIIAIGDNGEVGLHSSLPWPHNPADMQWFRNITMGKVCVVGHNTFQTLPNLNGRSVIVMDRDETPADLVAIYPDLVVIGGPATYKAWEPYIDRYYIARIRGDFEADAHMKGWAPWIKNS